VAHEPSSTPVPVQLRLPVLVFGLVEVRRLNRELEALEEFVRQAEIREPGRQAQLPRVSRLLDALATDNSMQLLQPAHRAQLKKFLSVVALQAPSLHMSFAVDPSSAFTSKMVTWLRANVHPWALLEVGLQPTIAAGCIVRTTNKVFDFSLRERFTEVKGTLVTSLENAAAEAAQAAMSAPEAVVAASAPATTVAVTSPATAPAQAAAPAAPQPLPPQPQSQPVQLAPAPGPVPAAAPDPAPPEHPALQAIPLPPSSPSKEPVA